MVGDRDQILRVAIAVPTRSFRAGQLTVRVNTATQIVL